MDDMKMLGTKRSFANMLNEDMSASKKVPMPKMHAKKMQKGTWDKMRDYASEAEATSYKAPHKRTGY